MRERRATSPVFILGCKRALLARTLVRQSQPPHQILESRIRTKRVESREAYARHQFGILFGKRFLQIIERFIAISGQGVANSNICGRRKTTRDGQELQISSVVRSGGISVRGSDKGGF